MKPKVIKNLIDLTNLTEIKETMNAIDLNSEAERLADYYSSFNIQKTNDNKDPYVIIIVNLVNGINDNDRNFIRPF